MLEVNNQLQPVVPIRQQSINRGFFDKSDPIEGIGFPLQSLSTSRSYLIESVYREKLEFIKDNLTTEIIKELNLGRIGNLKGELVDYQDARHSKEPPRRYIKIEHETVRGTLLTTFCRFHLLGDNFYIAIDTYILGPTNWMSFIFQIFILLSIVWNVPDIFDFYPLLLIFPSAYIYWIWIDVIRALTQGVSFQKAIRQRFNKTTSTSSFDFDDVSIYLKSVLPVILDAVQNVFKKNDLQIYGIEEDKNRINQQVINLTDNSSQVNMSGGTIANSAIGGLANKIIGR